MILIGYACVHGVLVLAVYHWSLYEASQWRYARTDDGHIDLYLMSMRLGSCNVFIIMKFVCNMVESKWRESPDLAFLNVQLCALVDFEEILWSFSLSLTATNYSLLGHHILRHWNHTVKCGKYIKSRGRNLLNLHNFPMDHERTC